MCLKKHGEIEFEYTCNASSLKKGRIKLALGILRQKYGFDKKWKELVSEMVQAILDAREIRGAGEKPFLQKYDPEMVHKDDGVLNGHDMVRVSEVTTQRDSKISQDSQETEDDPQIWIEFQDEIDAELRRLELIEILRQNENGNI